MSDWIDDARAYYRSEAGQAAHARWRTAQETRPEPEAWTPERVVEAQRETIQSLQARLRSAEKMIEALTLYGGRMRMRYRVVRRLAHMLAPDVTAEPTESARGGIADAG